MSHYFDPSPGTPSRPRQVELKVPGLTAALTSDRGVFSGGGVDPGTVELLKAVPTGPDPAGPILDLGCGYGPIAVTLAARCPASTVWAVDVNTRAVELTAANAAALGLANVRAVAPAGVPEGLTFEQIWSNPPIRIGKAALHDLLGRWLPRLAPGGTAWMVVQKNLGSDSLADWMRDSGFAVVRLGSRKGYRILQVRPG
ncbi:MAG TPA: methyltransferase [Acidimicrobiales bacterium]|nr:methyltransferase [Acidimicrobiales bacterium]